MSGALEVLTPRERAGHTAIRQADLNGLPALLSTYPPRPGALPRKIALWVELDRALDIVAIRGGVASAKLSAVRFSKCH